MRHSQRIIQPEDLLLFKTVSDVQLSPDGTRIAYTVTEIDIKKDRYKTNICIISAQSGEIISFRFYKNYSYAPRWSPDGKQIAFLSDWDDEYSQLYVISTEDGKICKLTSLGHGAGPAVWSPSGKYITFSAPVINARNIKNKTIFNDWNKKPKVVNRAQYKEDGQGFILDKSNQLFIITTKSGEIRQITYGDNSNLTPAWSPDNRRIVVTRTRDDVTEYNASDICIMDMDGSNQRMVTKNINTVVSPTWSPDGSIIAFYGKEDKRQAWDQTMTHVWIIQAAGGEPKSLMSNHDRYAILLPAPAITSGPVWSTNSDSVTFRISDAGNIHVVRANVNDGQINPVIIGERQITSFSAIPAIGRITFCVNESENPCNVYVSAWDGSEEKKLTKVNDSLLARLAIPYIEKRTFSSPNGGSIDAWVMRPVNDTRNAPLLLSIHGGPQGFVGNAFSLSHFYRYVLASQGWVVLTVNTSGSGSYGKEFLYSIRGRWGEYDLPEHLAAIDTLVEEGVVDENKLSIAGYSYGGYMTAWAISHTKRFKAAVMGGAITNLESLYGTSDIGSWYLSWYMKGNLFSKRNTFKRLSPIQYVDRVTTPTLILHGKSDERCPISQGEIFFIGLKKSNNAQVEFVRYPKSSHLFHSNGLPSHRVDFNRRIVDWIKRYI